MKQIESEFWNNIPRNQSAPIAKKSRFLYQLNASKDKKKYEKNKHDISNTEWINVMPTARRGAKITKTDSSYNIIGARYLSVGSCKNRIIIFALSIALLYFDYPAHVRG